MLVKPAQGVLGEKRLPPGSVVEHMVEEIDIMPSLADLAGLLDHIPATHAQGRSWAPLLRDPTDNSTVKSVVFNQYTHYSDRNKTTVNFLHC